MKYCLEKGHTNSYKRCFQICRRMYGWVCQKKQKAGVGMKMYNVSCLHTAIPIPSFLLALPFLLLSSFLDNVSCTCRCTTVSLHSWKRFYVLVGVLQCSCSSEYTACVFFCFYNACTCPLLLLQWARKQGSQKWICHLSQLSTCLAIATNGKESEVECH